MTNQAASDSSASVKAPLHRLLAPFGAIVWPGAAWIVLGLCLLGTVLGWQISLSQVHNRAGDRFQQNERKQTRSWWRR
jgi:hypothetical protein